MMVIDTPEAAQRLLEAFEEAEIRGPYKSGLNMSEILEESRRQMNDLKL